MRESRDETALFYQAAWPVMDARGKEIKTKDDYDTTRIDHVQKYTDGIRKACESFADGINQPLGKRAVFIVPLGDAIVKLRALIVADKFPGMKRQSERERVADVRYFTDGTGQNAVAITVNGVRDLPSTHVLVYDKQNKRLRVLKQAQGKWQAVGKVFRVQKSVVV